MSRHSPTGTLEGDIENFENDTLDYLDRIEGNSDHGTSRKWFYTYFGEHATPTTNIGITQVGERRITYVCGQLERCPSTGRAHFHFYAEFNRPCHGAFIKRCLSPLFEGIHWKQKHVRSTRTQAREYCFKEWAHRNPGTRAYTEGPRARWIDDNGQEAQPFQWGTSGYISNTQTYDWCACICEFHGGHWSACIIGNSEERTFLSQGGRGIGCQYGGRWIEIRKLGAKQWPRGRGEWWICKQCWLIGWFPQRSLRKLG